MKKHLLLFLSVIFSLSLFAAPKYEFRATWFATVTNIDWPTATNLTVDQQKAELRAILDKLQAGNINAVCLQVRSQSDALYKSSYEPWAVALTGTRGKDPGYDPLEYAIQEAHKRGMELHAWVNPFRISTTEGGRLTEAQVNNLYKGLSWSWVLAYNNVGSFTGQIIDPGYPAAREYIKNVVMEIAKYDIDGILMDDYFYPYGGTTTEDAVSKGLYKPNDVKDINGDGNTDDDWRRSNVDALIKSIYDELNTGANKKPWIRFGLAPFGVWTTQAKAAAAYGISLPNGISGQDCYEQLACNPIEWIKNGYVDYVSPQLYWPTATSPNDYRRAQDYHILYNWWSDICTHFSKELPGDQVVQFYPSHSADRVYDTHKWGTDEMRTQVGYNQKKLTHGYSGSVFFSTRYYLNLKNAKGEYICGTLDSTLCEQLHASHYHHKALVPPMAWKSTEELDAPNTLRINGKTLTWAHDNAERFTVYIYPKGVRCNQAVEDVNYLQGMVYGKSFALPNSFDITTHNVAVRAYDRYAVEHAPAEYGPDVTYVLNGGVVEYEEQITVPTNEELMLQFMEDYTKYYNITTSFVETFYNTKNVSGFLSRGKDDWSVNFTTKNMLTDANSGWKWLGDYIVQIVTAQSTTAVTTDALWRFNITAFFNQNKATAWPYSADFTTAGQPSAWGAAYIAAHTNMNVEPQPTNAELWTSFKPYYNTYYKLSRADQTIENVASFAATYMQDIMTNANSEYKWLGDYISSVVSAQGKAALSDESAWRWAVHAFFNCYDGTVQGTQKVATANFSTAGQPAAWKAAWDAAHTTSADPETSAYTLPDFIETALTLPTEDSRPVYITHPNEYPFAGWIDGNGNSIASLPAGYKGIVYAQWGADITWVLNGGVYTGKGDLPLHVHDTYILPTAFTMRKAGYKFVGWYASSDFQGDKLITINSGVGTLYAKWEPATPVIWHPYPYYDVTNEDLWELFMEDYNAFYNSDILGENRSNENRAYQPIGNVFGFMHSGEKLKNANGQWINKEGAVVGTEAEAHHRFPDGRAMDFMTHPQSPWKWLGDYITEVLEEENESLDSNAPLWTSFKEATGLTHLGALETMDFAKICGTGALDTDDKDGKTGETILTALFAQPEWEWLPDYLITVQNAVAGTVIGKTGDGKDITIQRLTKNNWKDRQWAFAVAAFFLQRQYTTWPASADFSTAGKHSVWKNIIPEEYHDLGHFRITNELEWRKTIAAFFNHSNVLTYTLNSGTTKTEGTADFRNLGLPKPNGDPAAGWYNAWWNATFPEYMIHGEALPKVKRYGYVFGGWYYGNEKGYIFTEANKANPAAYNSANNYKNHLWGRWLELCLYEGYVDKDIHSIAEKTKVNHNQELLSCISSDVTKKTYKLDIHRKFLSDGVSYSTLVLPFAIPRTTTNNVAHYIKQITDENGDFVFDPAKGGEMPSILICQEAREISVNNENMVELVFEELDVTSKTNSGTVAAVPAYVPFLIKPAKPLTPRLHFWSASVYHRENPYSPAVLPGMQLQPVLSPTVITATSDCPLILVDNNRLAQVYSSGEMLGLRGYFILQPELRNLPVKITMRDNTPSNTENISTDAMIVEIKKILRNGQVYIIRNGQMYDMMGNLVK